MQQSFHVGQLVRLVGPSSGSSDNRIYCIVCLVSSAAEEKPAFRVKNAVGRERLVQPHEIEPAALSAVP